MRCWVALLVVVVVSCTSILGMGVQYGGTSGPGTGAGTGSSSTSGTGSGSSQASGSQGAGQTGTGATGGSLNGFPGGARPASGGPAFAGLSGGSTFSGFSGPAEGGPAFPRGTSVIQQQITPTVTDTVTINYFTTLTDLVFQSYEVTLTQFVVETATRPHQQVVITPTNDLVAISTTVVHHPEYITLTETKSDFRLSVRTSVTHVTLTHTYYVINHVPFTITATETVHLTSPVVRTVINTQREVVTDYRTLVNTVYVHGGYY